MSDPKPSPPGSTAAATALPTDSTPAQAVECNPQVTDSVTQGSLHTLGQGPALATVNAYLGQTQAMTILFANMVNQQAQYATLATTSLSNELAQLYALGDRQ